MNRKYRILIAGAGGIGRATGLVLRELSDFMVDIWIGDADLSRAGGAADWICEGSAIPGEVVPFELPVDQVGASLEGALNNAEILLDCLPGAEAVRMASLALQYNLHYVNLTEHSHAISTIRNILLKAPTDRAFILQTGIAPGFITVLAHGLVRKFCALYNVDSVDSVCMKTGVLPATALPPHYYGLTWSPIGVAGEYTFPVEVLRDGARVFRPACSERATVFIDGMIFEEALTAGGTADLPEALAETARNVDYKTLRYPGHFDWVESVLRRMPAGADPLDFLRAEMEEAIPVVEEDVLVLYVSVEGKDASGFRRRLEKSLRIRHPIILGGKPLLAVQATMAAAIAEAVRLILFHDSSGLYLQSEIRPRTFLLGPFVSKIYGIYDL